MIFFRLVTAFIGMVLGAIFILPVVIIFSPFFLVLLILKIYSLLGPKIGTWKDTVEWDKNLGWKHKPNLNMYLESDDVYHITTGKDGNRGHYSLKDCDVVAIGDSFVFGYAGDDKNHFANFTKHAKVKPIGAQGYSTVHYLLLLKSLTKEIENKTVVWFVYTGNDYRESVRPSVYGYLAPFVFFNEDAKIWEIKADHISPKRTSSNYDRGYKIAVGELADLFHENYFSNYAFSAFEYLVKEAKKHCDENGARFVVATTPISWLLDGAYNHKIKRHSSDPDKFSLRYPDERAAAICKQNDVEHVPCFDLLERQDFLLNDLHWSPVGNRKVAKIIDDIYMSRARREKK
jgi:hypothetical protein